MRAAVERNLVGVMWRKDCKRRLRTQRTLLTVTFRAADQSCRGLRSTSWETVWLYYLGAGGIGYRQDHVRILLDDAGDSIETREQAQLRECEEEHRMARRLAEGILGVGFERAHHLDAGTARQAPVHIHALAIGGDPGLW